MRLGASTPEGPFLICDAVIPQESPRWSAGYVGYWYDTEIGRIYVYGRLLLEWIDVGHGLLSLQVDIGAAADPPFDPAGISQASPVLAEAVAAAYEEDLDAAIRQPGRRQPSHHLLPTCEPCRSPS